MAAQQTLRKYMAAFVYGELLRKKKNAIGERKRGSCSRRAQMENR
jgi:hypothetical protein